MIFPLPIRSILFDLDGTLVHTLPDLAASVNAMLRELNRPPCTEEQVGIWIGNGMDKLLIRALRHADTSEPDNAILNQARAAFRQDYDANYCIKSHLYPGVQKALKQLHSLDFKLAVVTNKPSQFTRPLLRALEIERYFNAVVGGDDAPVKKPDPAPLFLALEQMDMPRENVLMVGDSRNDIQAARNAGFPVVCLPYGYNHGDPITSSSPDRLIQSLAELPALVHLP